MNNVRKALVKKKVLTLDSKDIDTINNSDIYDTYRDLYLSEKKREEKLLQGIQSINDSKARVGAKKADGTALTEAMGENTIKKTFDKRFAIPLYFDFLSIVYPYGLKEDLIVRLELNSSEKLILCTGDTSATYMFPDKTLEYDAIFDEPYARTVGEMHTRTTSIPYTTVTSIHYQTLLFLFVLGRAYCYYFLTNVMILPTKMKNVTTQASRKF